VEKAGVYAVESQRERTGVERGAKRKVKRGAEKREKAVDKRIREKKEKKKIPEKAGNDQRRNSGRERPRNERRE